MNPKSKKILTDQLDSFKTIQGQKGVIILYNGNQLVMPSGKRIWTQRRFALSALSNAMGYVEYRIREATGETKRVTRGEYIKQLEYEGIIEFKELK